MTNKIRPWTKPTVYVVFYPIAQIAKVGVSQTQRWTTFAPRGGELVATIEFDARSAALEFEAATLQQLRGIFPAGFISADEAAPYLGNGGGGWGECMEIARLSDLLEALPWLRHRAAIGSEMRNVRFDDDSNVRTNGRTDVRNQDRGDLVRVLNRASREGSR